MRGDLSRAATAVRVRLAELGWNATNLARQSDVDPGTIGEFLAAKRLPRIATRSRIEAALGWPPGSIEAAALGKEIHVEALDPGNAEAALFASYDAHTPLEKVRLLQDLARKFLDEMNEQDGA